MITNWGYRGCRVVQPFVGEHRCPGLSGLRRINVTGSLPIVVAVNLNHPGRYLHWGVVQISVANAVVIVAMAVVFVAALVLPFPGPRGRE